MQVLFNLKDAMKFVAASARSMGAAGVFFLISLGLCGCSVLQTPVRPVVYDFGPGAVAATASAQGPALRTLALADVEAAQAQDSHAVQYRLMYSDNQQLRPYAQARWSMPPAQLLRQRLREQLGQRRAVLNTAQGSLVAAHVLVLHVELDEFSQLFETPAYSSALVRLHATLGQTGAGGEQLLAQRSFVVQRAAASADASGGVRALTQASDAAIEQIDQWLQQTPAPEPAR